MRTLVSYVRIVNSSRRPRYLLLFLRASGMKVALLLQAAAVALSKVVDSEAMISNFLAE